MSAIERWMEIVHDAAAFKVGAVVEALIPDAEARVRIRKPLRVVERVFGAKGGQPAFSHYVAVDADGTRYDITGEHDPHLAETADPDNNVTVAPEPRSTGPGGAPKR